MNRDVERFFWFAVMEKAEVALLKAIAARKANWIVDEKTLGFDVDNHRIKGKVDILGCLVSAKHSICINDVLWHSQTDRIVSIINICNELSGEYPLEMITENVPVTDLIKKAKEKVAGDKAFIGNEWLIENIEDASRWYLDYLCTEKSQKIIDDVRYADYHLVNNDHHPNPNSAFPHKSFWVLLFFTVMYAVLSYGCQGKPLKTVGDLFYLFPISTLMFAMVVMGFKFLSDFQSYRKYWRKVRSA